MSIKAKDMTPAERKERVTQLVKQFKENEAFYLSKDFVESEVRNKFIDPLLECLKWDVKNEKGARHDRQEVITEDRVVMNGQVKHPDYTLCYGGERKMYVEAKQPSVDLKTNPEPALQVRRYAYTSKMPIAVLTDFQELAIYDTRIKPSEKDTAATARIEYLTYDTFAEKFEWLYDKISWDAVDLGTFDTYYESNKDKRGTATVDDDILNMIEKWRIELAEDIALHNEGIDEFNLTGAVQKIIDRILFLRICEDKEIEEGNRLKKITAQKTDIYKNLQKLFESANAKFNAGLFASDTWLDELAVADKTLISIINALYYPECQYEFSVLPVEILGSIYERFLGKIIRFTRKTKNGHSVEILEKPEVQKAGGVYYTPPYIVKYIVENTIGKKLAGKTPDEVSRLRFVDPACGSGSFLVGAYQYLLDWHLDRYYAEEQRTQAEKKGLIYKDVATQGYKLSIEEKKRILLNNIYGVDIDAQAVEVTKLSLFLKLLENEGKALSTTGQAALFRTSDIQAKILPDMSHNIKCGNSLIGTDYYAGKDLTLFGIEEQRKVNAFDWDIQFPDVFAHGGFDCVIGNPPYVFARDSKDKGMSDDDKYYYTEHYSIAKYQINLYHLFIEKSTLLLADNGLFAFIIPNNWLTINTNKDLRNFILHKSDVSILNFKYKVFDGADVDTCILIFLNNQSNTNMLLLQSSSDREIKKIKETKTTFFSEQTDLIINTDLFSNEQFFTIINQIEKNSYPLDEYASIKAGLQAYEVGKGMPTQTKKMKDERIYHSLEKKDENYFKYLDGNDIKRYELTWERREYLCYGKNLAAPRGDWNLFSSPRILVRQIPSKPPYCINACYTADVYLNDRNSMNVIYIKNNPLFILAILNSRAVSFWFEHKFGKLSRGIFPQFKINELARFPIPSATAEQQSSLAGLAEQMMLTVAQLHGNVSDSDKKFLQQRVDILDRQINTVVYGLYGLTADEVKVVEGKE
ncbi:Eco57I restriction-modification methylase domain-containing protein [Treponema socranskii]|uniref:Eco57I restriction-modification methylase domain-containing protein n=1 Tax=Treponema socranskii TaxID=53419 RepID=UPI003D6EEDA1